ncbi:MAG: hypothetical protein RSF68_09820 [Myroides sp.]
MRAYAEEGLSIVEVLPEPKYKYYDIIDKGWFVILPLIAIALFFHRYLPDFVTVFIFVLSIVYYWVNFFYVRIGNLLRSENITYNSLGKIYFNMDFVEILNRRYDLFEIENMEFTCVDFEDKYIGGGNLYSPVSSAGIYNFLSIRFADKTVVKYQFKLLNEIHMFSFRKELIHYYKLGLIRELNLHDILGNHSFESKSDFRKHNPKYNA